ncbi:stress response protein AzuC [Pectobacterium sp. CHL-2024]|uniref:Stress response protein AzuC n=13 Tax=Pectobacterium TaxID=122277 RepID=A0A9X8P6N2_9GAMM|nr:stress response protein AzuC [Pectobacterium versatile]MCA6939609.1 stress response protein AzuC [Pectobacterium polaris]MCA6967007.1 stress response protein AzuC [Pectobacterium carotovorum]RYC45580.1 stress response protein AzuC [Pectobacterium zantedeschiae]TKY82094.1 stress response protein AzuC [Pectobacterium polonicum]UEM41466.1 stress response protein AzuC [Pectobacterium aquaticum]
MKKVRNFFKKMLAAYLNTYKDVPPGALF